MKGNGQSNKVNQSPAQHRAVEIKGKGGSCHLHKVHKGPADEACHRGLWSRSRKILVILESFLYLAEDGSQTIQQVMR